MGYKPGDTYVGEFVTKSAASGAGTQADSTPTCVMVHNGTDDGSVSMTVTQKTLLYEYKVTGTIPAGYAAGDTVHIKAQALVGGTAGAEIIDSFVLDSKRLADVTTGTAVNLPATVLQTADHTAIVADVTTGLNTAIPSNPTANSPYAKLANLISGVVGTVVASPAPTASGWTASGLSTTANEYLNAYIIWLPGAVNYGAKWQQISGYTAAQGILLANPFPSAPAAGDKFIIAG